MQWVGVQHPWVTTPTMTRVTVLLGQGRGDLGGWIAALCVHPHTLGCVWAGRLGCHPRVMLLWKG